MDDGEIMGLEACVDGDVKRDGGGNRGECMWSRWRLMDGWKNRQIHGPDDGISFCCLLVKALYFTCAGTTHKVKHCFNCIFIFGCFWPEVLHDLCYFNTLC